MHHAYADTEQDVHSPKHDGTLWKMMIKTKDIYMDIFTGKMKIDPKFLGSLPEWNSFDKFASAWPTRVAMGILYVMFYIYFADYWWLYLLLPIHFLMSPIHGAIINWFAHKVGYRNHNVEDTSTNIFPVEIFMLGEALHNNHHKMGTRPNFAQKWFEFDPTYAVILVFNAIGIIKLKKQ
jgi:stearoyl-CoA desaturase (delta-9 desaturase)